MQDQDREERLGRLVQLADADEGFFVLGLHSFYEWFARESEPALRNLGDFADLLWAFRERLAARGRTTDELVLITRLIREHSLLDGVVRSFGKVDAEEARAATHNFLRFCSLCGIESPLLAGLEARVRSWEEKRPALGQQSELKRIQEELLYAQEDGAKLLAQTEQWARDKQSLAELDGETMRLTTELGKENERLEKRHERIAQIRGELAALAEEKKRLVEKLEAYRDLDGYVRQVSRFSLYTRTRMDYERSVMRLSAEQREAVEAIRPGFDFLIRGGAGTGKTIALLHALQRAKQTRSEELALGPSGRLLFLTYTNTLVKYDRYVAEILKEGEAESLIVTADSFLQSRLQELKENLRVDYAIVTRLAEKLNTTPFFSPQELATEIEDFIFGSLVSRQEYVEERIPRRGMRQPLSQSQREEVWAIRDRMVEQMEHDHTLSRNYSRMKLIERLGSREARDGGIDAIFIDESQDLSAADLRALKLLSRRGLVMAGDTGQSIYGVSSPYKRAGVDISGRTRVLHTSFRNTVPIQDLAEAYRQLCGLEDDEAAGTVAFREGPIPELYTASTRQELATLLLRKAALFIERLGYDPENVTVLAPTKTDLATVGDALGHAGYRYANIRDEEFSFKLEKTIRLSSLHSSKGLDFAVVLLYLPSLPVRQDYDERTANLLMRNLIYVAMTRAMDNLNVFTLEGAHEGQQEEPLQDLVRVFRRHRARMQEKGTTP